MLDELGFVWDLPLDGRKKKKKSTELGVDLFNI